MIDRPIVEIPTAILGFSTMTSFIPTSYSGKVTKEQRPTLNRNFLLSRKPEECEE